MKKVLLTAVVAMLVLGGIVWAMAARQTTDASGKLTVMASYYPLYDFARQIGGTKVQVSNLTPTGSEPHDYDPSPRVMAQAQSADVFIYNGANLEPWASDFLREYAGMAVRASSGIAVLETGDDHESDRDHDGKSLDPHFWLDPQAAQQIAATIRDGLIKADPANASYYRQQAGKYRTELRQLDSDFQKGLATCQTRTIVTSHEAFGYLAARYNLRVAAIAGMSTDEEPSAAKLAELADLVRREGIRYVFFESLVSPRLADTIAAETGARTLKFDPIEGITNEQAQQGASYLSLQRQNLANLRTALACQ